MTTENRNSKNDKTKEGWNSDAPSGEEAVQTEERSLDIGESGQFAPGGYYNQQGVNAPKRKLIDDDVLPPARR